MFQSALPHGERLDTTLPLAIALSFQSALPHGERPDCNQRAPGFQGFNPRSRMGSDVPATSGRLPRAMFQSALPHGERLHGCVGLGQVLAGFNPRSRMGSDPTVSTVALGVAGFNPRSRMGSDWQSCAALARS